jgi:hypothetical protein
MSLISGYLNQTASHYVTAEFYNGAPLDEIPLNNITIGEDFRVRAERSGTAGDPRHVYLVGTLDGEPVTETLTFTSGLYGPELIVTSDELFDDLTEVTTDMGGDYGITISIRAVDAAGDEIPPTWQEFACRWEDKRSTYLKVSDDEASEVIAVSDAKVICEAQIEAEALVRPVVGGVPGIVYEVKVVKSTPGLSGSEEFRVLLLGGVGE